MSFVDVQRGLPPVNEVYNSPVRKPTRLQTPKFLKNDSSDNESYRSEDPPPELKVPLPQHSGARGKMSAPLQNMSVFKTEPTGSAWEEYPESMSLEDGEDDEDDVSRARKYGGFVLIFLPPIFFALAVQFLKFLMPDFHVYVLGLCVFQGVLWPALLYIVYLKVTGRISGARRIHCNSEGIRDILELMVLGVLSSGAVLLQILSFQRLDITVSLAITFSPLIISAFIEHIHREKRLPFELLVATLVAYTGLTLLTIPAILMENKKEQRSAIIGIGASVGSMLLAFPASLQISRLRRKGINDCVTAAFHAGAGTILSLIIGLVLLVGSKYSARSDANPWKIIVLIGFVLTGTFFLIFEANFRKSYRRAANLSRARAGVFILSGIWEIIKICFIPRDTDSEFPSVFTIFGILLLVLSYLFAASFQVWFEERKRKTREKRFGSELYLIPWLFSKKS